MSSSSVMQDICQWSPEQCKEAVDSIMPKLISCLDEGSSRSSKVDALKILVNSFLRCFEAEEAEDKFFSKVLVKVPVIFNELLDSIRNPGDSCSDLKKLREDSLEAACQVIEVLILCIKFFESGVSLAHMYSLPDNVLQVLTDSYNHCKESDCIYGEMLELLSESLGLFFRKIQTLQMEFMGLLDRMTLCSGYEKDVQILSDLCLRISDLCQLVSSLDIKIAAGLWKTYTKLIVRYQSCLKDRLDVDKVLKFLCEDTSSRIRELEHYFGGQQEQDENFHHTVKICSFNLKLISTICEKFQDYLGENLKEVCQLILVLYKLSVSCFSCSPSEKSISDSLLNHLVVAVDALLLHVSNNRHFFDIVQNKFNEDLPSDLNLPFSLLCLSFLGLKQESGYDEELLLFEHSQLTLFETVFSVIHLSELNFFMPLNFPGIMCEGKPQRLVSLYEHMCTGLCAFVAGVSADNFHILEESMVKILLNGSGVTVYLICDIWCFLARYGSADLCYTHCTLLAKLIAMITDKRALFVKWLLQRLYRFLLPEQKKKLLLEQQHVEDYIQFCHENEVNEKYWLRGFTILGNEAVHLKTHSDIKILFEELRALNHMVTRNASSYVKDVAHQAVRTWSVVLGNLCTTQHGTNIACLLLQTATSLVSIDEGRELLELLQFAENMWQTGSDVIQLSVIFFLRPWASKYISPIPEQKQILGQLISLLVKAVSSKQYILRQEALQAFSKLAHSTPHQNVIPECLRIAPQLQRTITAFLHKEPVEGSLFEDDLKNVLREQFQFMKDSITDVKEDDFAQLMFSFDMDINEASASPEENPAKKQCTENTPEDKHLDNSSSLQVSHHMNQLTEFVRKLEVLQPLPDWALKDLKLLSQKINALS